MDTVINMLLGFMLTDGFRVMDLIGDRAMDRMALTWHEEADRLGWVSRRAPETDAAAMAALRRSLGLAPKSTCFYCNAPVWSPRDSRMPDLLCKPCTWKAEAVS